MNFSSLSLPKPFTLKKKSHSFTLTEEYIELIKFLKLLGIADTGSDAKQLVDDGEVKLNDAVEYRKRAKLRKGDRVLVKNTEIIID
jgi:ribosome-associated protein